MTLVELIIAFVVVALALFLLGLLFDALNTEARVRQVAYILVIVLLVLWALQRFGLLGPLGNIRVN